VKECECCPTVRGSRALVRRIGSDSNIKADNEYGRVHVGNGM